MHACRAFARDPCVHRLANCHRWLAPRSLYRRYGETALGKVRPQHTTLNNLFCLLWWLTVSSRPCVYSIELGRAFEGWYDGMARQIDVQKLLHRAAAIWKNREMMRSFNMWCWYCQDCAEAREQELLNRAAERQRRREAWLLKQLFKGVQDEFEGMDTEPDAETLELRRMAEKEICEVAAEAEAAAEAGTLSQTHSKPTCEDGQPAA